MSHVLSMHMLRRSGHLVCHAPYQPQIIYLTHNEVLTWDGELNSAFIVIFKNVFAFKCAVHMKSSAYFHNHLKSALHTEHQTAMLHYHV